MGFDSLYSHRVYRKVGWEGGGHVGDDLKGYVFFFWRGLCSVKVWVFLFQVCFASLVSAALNKKIGFSSIADPILGASIEHDGQQHSEI